MSPWKHSPSGPPRDRPDTAPMQGQNVCDYCSSPDLEWVKCKLICRNCRQINKSCADL